MSEEHGPGPEKSTSGPNPADKKKQVSVDGVVDELRNVLSGLAQPKANPPEIPPRSFDPGFLRPGVPQAEPPPFEAPQQDFPMPMAEPEAQTSDADFWNGNVLGWPAENPPAEDGRGPEPTFPPMTPPPMGGSGKTASMPSYAEEPDNAPAPAFGPASQNDFPSEDPPFAPFGSVPRAPAPQEFPDPGPAPSSSFSPPWPMERPPEIADMLPEAPPSPARKNGRQDKAQPSAPDPVEDILRDPFAPLGSEPPQAASPPPPPSRRSAPPPPPPPPSAAESSGVEMLKDPFSFTPVDLSGVPDAPSPGSIEVEHAPGKSVPVPGTLNSRPAPAPVEEGLDLEGTVLKPADMMQVACIYLQGQEKAGQQFVSKLRDAGERAKKSMTIQAVFVHPWTESNIDLEAWKRSAKLSGADLMFILGTKNHASIFDSKKGVEAGEMRTRFVCVDHVPLRTLYADILVEMQRGS